MQHELTNQQAYQQLSDNYVHWDRKDANHIIVWTSGYETADCHDIEEFLMRAGMRCCERKFDRMCGKTYSVYRHLPELDLELDEDEVEAAAEAEDVINCRVGSGKTIHIGTKFRSAAGHMAIATRCGADHATNRGAPRVFEASGQVTCKRCLKTLAS